MKFTFNRKIVAPYGDSRGVTASTSGSDPGDGGSTPPGTYFFALLIDDDAYNFCIFPTKFVLLKEPSYYPVLY